MATWNTGSVVDYVGDIIGWTKIPASVSGTRMLDMASQAINIIEQYTSDSISDDAISEKYQPVVIKLTQADTLEAKDMQEEGVDNVSLGPLKVSSGYGGSNSSTVKQLRDDANKRLKELQRKPRFKRVIGG